MKLVLMILLIFLLVSSIVIDKATNILSEKELKRRARVPQNRTAKNLFKLAAFGSSLKYFIWSIAIISAALIFILFLRTSWLAELVFIGLLYWSIRNWHPKNSNSWVVSYSSFLSTPIYKLLNLMQPILSKFPPLSAHIHHQVYEKEDLLDLLQSQSRNPDNRIPDLDLKMAESSLTFGDKTIGSVMTPLRKVKFVYKEDEIGPLLMDELHSSGFSRFPVVEEKNNNQNPKIIGTLYLRDLLDHRASGRVRDLMDHKVYFVNETSLLRSALDTFLKTHHHLFIVVNGFEEVVGVLTIEDVLEQILAQEIVDEFDQYDDLRAVAAKEATKEHHQHSESHPVEEPEQL